MGRGAEDPQHLDPRRSGRSGWCALRHVPPLGRHHEVSFGTVASGPTRCFVFTRPSHVSVAGESRRWSGARSVNDAAIAHLQPGLANSHCSPDPGASPRTTAGDHRVSTPHTTRPIHRPARSALRRGAFRDRPEHLVRHAAVLAGCAHWTELADRGGLWIAPLPTRPAVAARQEGASARPHHARARIPAPLCPGSWRHLRCPGGRRLRSRPDHRWLAPRGSRRGTPNAARRHRLLPRLQDVLPALVGPFAVRPTIRLRRPASQAARSASASRVARPQAGRLGPGGGLPYFSAARTSSVLRTRPRRGKSVATVWACSAASRAAIASSTKTWM